MPSICVRDLVCSAAVVFGVLALEPGFCHATTILVPTQQPTIQEGIDAAVEGDTVLVLPGSYSGALNRNLDFDGVNMVLMSRAGPESTAIDCGQAGRAFYIHSREDLTTCISGVTITFGSESYGGAVRISNSSPKLMDCVFIQNTATGDGGAVYSEASAAPVIRDCEFSMNTAVNGGALFMTDSFGEIVGCVFSRNVAASGAAVYLSTFSEPLVDGCVFEDNNASGGGGLYTFLSESLITGCTFRENTATSGGGMYIYGVYGPTVVNCSIVDNTGHGIYCHLSEPVIANCVIAFNSDEAIDCTPAANPATGNCVVFANGEGDSLCGAYADNLFADPLLCDIYSGDLSLCQNSPCLPGNNGWGILVGALEQGCGDCDAAVEPASWGEIKQLFR